MSSMSANKRKQVFYLRQLHFHCLMVMQKLQQMFREYVANKGIQRPLSCETARMITKHIQKDPTCLQDFREALKGKQFESLCLLWCQAEIHILKMDNTMDINLPADITSELWNLILQLCFEKPWMLTREGQSDEVQALKDYLETILSNCIQCRCPSTQGGKDLALTKILSRPAPDDQNF